MNVLRSGDPDDVEYTLSPGSESPQPEAPKYLLRLYVTGKAPNSLRALSVIREICEECLNGRYQLQVIDIYQQPALAEGDHILVAPTLVRRAPGPMRRLIGNLADRERVLAGLELQAAAGG
jgi:circadian clock protein KaiB